jgi:group I intron endonuclease
MLYSQSMANFGIIYKITNKLNNKVYIGSTIRSLEERWYGHVYQARRGEGTHLHKAIRKYGPAAFEKEIIYTLKEGESLDIIEQKYIDEYQATKSKYGYNAIGVLKGNRDLIRKTTKADWAKPKKRKERIKKMIEGSRHRFESIVSVHIQSGEVKYYESVHAAMRDGVAQSAIYFCLNGKDKTGQKRCWFRKEEGLTDQDYKNKALLLIGEFKTSFTVPIIAINRHTNIEKEFKDIYECSAFVGIEVKKIRRHIKGDKGYSNYIKDYKFKYKA